MTRKNPKGQSNKVRSASSTSRTSAGAPPTVSGRWLLIAVSIAIVAAAGCAWLTLCLLFWQGSWQLLYHPDAQVKRSPSDAGLAYDSVAFAASDAGAPQLKGWWVPAAADARYGRFTVLYLHGEKGNLGDAVDDVAALHAVGLNVLAFDYRGYGQSAFVRPTEAHWREDAEWALSYLTGTRHVAANAIVLDGRGLGANLALEVAAAHGDLAGVVVDSPVEHPMDAVFGDARARLVPAKLLVRDRWDAEQAGTALLVPSLWVLPADLFGRLPGRSGNPAGYDRITAKKMTLWTDAWAGSGGQFADGVSRWLDELPQR